MSYYLSSLVYYYYYDHGDLLGDEDGGHGHGHNLDYYYCYYTLNGDDDGYYCYYGENDNKMIADWKKGTTTKKKASLLFCWDVMEYVCVCVRLCV